MVKTPQNHRAGTVNSRYNPARAPAFPRGERPPAGSALPGVNHAILSIVGMRPAGAASQHIMAIPFEPTNLSAAMVGAKHGLTPEEAAASQPAALAALAGFHKRADAGEYGFPHLPFQTALIREVKAYAKSVAGDYDTVCVVGIGGSALGAWALDRIRCRRLFRRRIRAW
jgi:hypothetical protein